MKPAARFANFAKININTNIKVNKTLHSHLLEVQQEHVGTDPFFLVCKAVWCEMIRANMKAQTTVGNPHEGIPASILWAYRFKNKTQPLRLQRLGFRNIQMTAVFLITSKNRTPQSLRCHSAPAYKQWRTTMTTAVTAHSGRVLCCNTAVNHNSGRGVRSYDVTISNGLISERVKHIRSRVAKGRKISGKFPESFR